MGPAAARIRLAHPMLSALTPIRVVIRPANPPPGSLRSTTRTDGAASFRILEQARPAGGKLMKALRCIAVAIVSVVSGLDLHPLKDFGGVEAKAADEAPKIEELQKEVHELELKVGNLAGSVNRYKTAVFDPLSDQGFARLDTFVGTMIVSFHGLKPRTDGVEVQLDLGNLTSATIGGGTFKMRWGPAKPKMDGADFGARLIAWQRSLQSGTQELTEDLRPGVWNNVRLALPGASTDTLGYLELEFETKHIKLVPHRSAPEERQ